MAVFDDRPICEDCGDRILNAKVHEKVCNTSGAFDGECPMCGQGYDSYLAHLVDCPAERG